VDVGIGYSKHEVVNIFLMTGDKQGVTYVLSAIEALSYIYEPCVWALSGKNGGNNYIHDFTIRVLKFRNAGEKKFPNS